MQCQAALFSTAIKVQRLISLKKKKSSNFQKFNEKELECVWQAWKACKWNCSCNSGIIHVYVPNKAEDVQRQTLLQGHSKEWFCSTGSSRITVCYCDDTVFFHKVLWLVGNLLLLTTFINMNELWVSLWNSLLWLALTFPGAFNIVYP